MTSSGGRAATFPRGEGRNTENRPLYTNAENLYTDVVFQK